MVCGSATSKLTKTKTKTKKTHMGNVLRNALPEKVLYTYRNIGMSPLIREVQLKTRMRKRLHTHGVIFPGRGAKRDMEEKLAGSGLHSWPCRSLRNLQRVLQENHNFKSALIIPRVQV